MSETLLQYVLQRLSQVEDPVFLHNELNKFSEIEINNLREKGILRETSRATEIPRPNCHPDRGYLLVRNTSHGIFGVADAEEYFDPIPLSEDDIRQYKVSLPKLVDEIRRENEIVGQGFESSEGLLHIGSKNLEGYTSAEIYLSLSLSEESKLLLHCQRLKNSHNLIRNVVLTTTPLSLTPSGQLILLNAGVRLAHLTGNYAVGEMKVHWEHVLERTANELTTEYSVEARIFQNLGASWRVVYKGIETSFKDTKGMKYLSHLIQNPGQSIHALQLSGNGSNEELAPFFSSEIRILDPKAELEYKRKLETLNEAIKDAEAEGRIDEILRLREEFNTIADQLKSAKGIRGRSRKVPDDAERARQAVSKAIHSTLKAIKNENESLWKHFNASLQIGEYLSYKPDQPIVWTC